MKSEKYFEKICIFKTHVCFFYIKYSNTVMVLEFKWNIKVSHI